MTREVRRKVEKKVHEHTSRVMFECANRGHGANVSRALKSANRLIDMIEEISNDAYEAGKITASREIAIQTSPG